MSTRKKQPKHQKNLLDPLDEEVTPVGSPKILNECFKQEIHLTTARTTVVHFSLELTTKTKSREVRNFTYLIESRRALTTVVKMNIVTRTRISSSV